MFTLLTAVALLGADYHVTVNGSKDAACTESAPCSLQNGLDTVQAGDVLYVNAGTYLHGSKDNAPFVYGRNDGTADSKINIIARGEVILNGSNRLDVFWEQHGDHTIIDGFQFTGMDRNAIVLQSTNHVEVKNCIASAWDSDGHISGCFRLVGACNYSGFYNCMVVGNGAGTMEAFEFRENPTLGSSDTVPPAGADYDTFDGLIDGVARHCYVRDCIAWNVGASKDHSDVCNLRYAVDSFAEGNVFFQGRDDALDLLGNTRTIVRGNILFDERQDGNNNCFKAAARGGLHCQIYDNVMMHCGNGVNIEKCAGCWLTNNTFVDCDGRGISLGLPYNNYSGHGFSIVNNICQGAREECMAGDGGAVISEYDYNLWSDTPAKFGSSSGANNLFAADAEFAAYTQGWMPDTDWPAGSSAAQAIDHVRQQVMDVFVLRLTSLGRGTGKVIPGITPDSSVDRGAIQSSGEPPTQPPTEPPPATEVGACCNESTWTCVDGVTEAACLHNRWHDTESCAQIDPPCRTPEPLPPSSNLDQLELEARRAIDSYWANPTSENLELSISAQVSHYEALQQQ